MEKPIITRECVKPLLETKFIKVYDLQYAEGKHYYDATRHPSEELTATKTDEEFKKMLPDAVTVFMIVKRKEDAPRLLLAYEYRYPTGRFLLSPPAGLLDAEDKTAAEPLISATVREIREETGIAVDEGDRVFTVSPLAFSTPGMTDESNALVCAVVNLDGKTGLSQDGAVGSECFDGFELLSRAEAMEILKRGRDRYENFYSVYTWAALMYFCSGMWEEL